MQIVTILVMVITLVKSMPAHGKWTQKHIQVARQKNMQIYQVYKALEEALVEDKQQLFLLKQTFFPPYVPHNWKVDGVDIVPMLCSLTIDNIQTCSNVTPDNAPEQHTELSFIWANSLLYALFPVEQLMAMDRIVSKQILDTLMHSYFTSRQVTLSLHLKQLSCKATKDDLFNSLAVLTSWVRRNENVCICPISFTTCTYCIAGNFRVVQNFTFFAGRAVTAKIKNVFLTLPRCVYDVTRSHVRLRKHKNLNREILL